jgi:uncharacterized protein (DUF2141 family)
MGEARRLAPRPESRVKFLFLSSFLFLFCNTGHADPARSVNCTLRIHASGFRSQKGAAGAALFRSSDGWPENLKKAYTHDGGFLITGGQSLLTFHVPAGSYGVVVLHDENKNQKLDRNFLGVPVEGFGFANNPRVFLTAPPFQSALVNVACPVTDIAVKIIYK